MKKCVFLLVASSALALAACGSETPDEGSADVAMDAAADSSAGSAMTEVSGDAPGPLSVSLPKIAYDYGLAFALPAQDVGNLMRRHATICEQQGPASCRIVGMDLSGSAKAGDVRGQLRLQVASNHARAVGALLEREAGEMNAEQTGATIGSEEVSKQIVDAEARIAARTELRDRLSEVLRTRKGSVKELVEAERQVAQVNEEIDAARSWLSSTRGRVVMSSLDIDYASEAGTGASFTRPIAGVMGMAGTVMGHILAALLLLGLVLAPIAAIAWAVRSFSRRFERSPQP